MGDKAVVGVVDDMGENMQCVDHPYRSNPGGVCAFCLQEKLGNLVSSSKSTPFFSLQPAPSSSSSSPTSFRSDAGVVVGGGVGFASGYSRAGSAGGGRRTKFPFLAASHSKNKKSGGGGGYGNGGRKVMASVATTTSNTDVSASARNDGGFVLNRSRSVAPRTGGGLVQGGGGIRESAVADSPRKKSFWSFLYLSSASSTHTASSITNDNSSSSSNVNRRRSTSSSSVGRGDRDVSDKQQKQQDDPCTAGPMQGVNGVDEAESPCGSQSSSSFGRKVARSRSVGCGSRSFSGDFLERISTGFGDCTLRRVESHREAKPKAVLNLEHHDNEGEQLRPTVRERVSCGGLFGGFGMMSSFYWLSAATADDGFDDSSRIPAATRPTAAAAQGGGRTRSWGWALASPMRAFKPYSKSLNAINNAAASAAPATNVISSINGSNKMVSDGGSSSRKGHKLAANPSSLAVGS
ncbi:unnamed protein product [Musa acuminata subsp. malaccensis]|uniref:(wild Malaysian banana) hypothetical protein n=1 Tax=Musa acuminata subsp. malaccensis TaxID=214687 RepID=A0A804I5Z2_MUSAM|nr:PREDICTED: uncharacterized transmembrane protein DDB_G0289901-like [Musa acuminata subsp. malaccensis]CAG1862895.1 unnamed protein product [Musa acuminata subsp. malaccensis]